VILIVRLSPQKEKKIIREVMKGNNNSVNKIVMASESMEENSFSDFSFSHPLSLPDFFIAFALKHLMGNYDGAGNGSALYLFSVKIIETRNS
jgi:hypothetical protein